MNNPHQKPRLTRHSRDRIVARVLAGRPVPEVAAAFAVSVRTVRTWLARFRAGGGARDVDDWPGSTRLNPCACRARRFAKALRWPGIRHIFTRPHSPKTDGTAERSIRTLMRAWACGLAHPSSQARNADLPRRLTGSTQQDHTPHWAASHPPQG